jgi:pSer/pThr/pTyr-binding forkhead associated (FHA) protein
MLKAKLVVVGGDAKAKEVNLKLPCVIGRGREATLTLPHPLVSRQHTEIFEKDGKLFVKDLGSLNGTFLNNKRLVAEQPLEPNQLLTLGNVTFRAVYEIGDEIGDAVNETAGGGETLAIPTGHFFERPSQETKPMEDVAAAPKSPKPTSLFDRETVYEDEVKSSTSDTHKSRINEKNSEKDEAIIRHPDRATPAVDACGASDLFEGVETGQEQPSKVSSVDGLPAASAAVSFSGGLDLGESAAERSAVDALELEIADGPVQKDVSESGLDSFIRKLPK